MKKLYSVTICIMILMVTTFSGFAQNKSYWTLHTGTTQMVTAKGVARATWPKEFKLFDLNINPLRQTLFTVVDNAQSHSTVISLPNASGQLEEFEVFEASNFEPALQARFPEIRAFSGKGITDKYATLKLSISPQGIQTMVFRTEKPNEFIEAYSQDHNTYAVFVSQRTTPISWACNTVDRKFTEELNAQVLRTGVTGRNTGDLKTMRLAQSCNGEYANYFGATSSAQVALVLAAFNATLTRCNGCYEKDLAVHLNLIPTTINVIYYTPASDPYTTLGQWNSQLQTTLTSIIGEANYDIGHMFGASGGGGNAGCIGCICVNNQKGSGITSPADAIPEGDNFDIDYVVHEVGHQMGANHTFSMSNEGSGVNKEIGSGITIMGYAGITSQDVAPHSIDIYHEASITQIQANLLTKTCPVTTSLAGNNATPVVDAVANYIIPKSTPFALTGSATDADNDPITYCWEQDDNAASNQTGNNSVAIATKATGPNWISFSPSVSPTRICPKLSTILAGQLISGPLTGGDAVANTEALSSVARTLKFRLTVRDNSPYTSTAPIKVGQTAYTDMTVTVNGTAGPFGVSAPNTTGISWQAGTTQTVTWTVNGSDLAPVSCANVKISLSTDGGYTWPVVLIDNTPNDGSQDVVVPNNVTTTARIKVESIGNIFFDINNANFAITAPTIGFLFGTSAGANITCGTVASATASLSTTSNGGFTTPINLTATGNPAGTTVTFGTNPLTPGNTTTVILNNTSSLTPGTYNVSVSGIAGAVSQTATVAFVVAATTPPTVTAQPSNASVCVGNDATFTASSSTPGVNYQWQVSTDGGATWTDIAGANSSTYTLSAAALSANNNKYRAVITTQCGLVNTSSATLTVNVATAITSQPSNVTLCTGNNATFSSTATGNGVTYQWQVSTDGGATWNNITGATNANYTINAVTIASNGNKYRVIATVTTGGCPGSLNSNTANLTVNATPNITSNSSASSACSGTPVTLTAGGANTYSWTPGNLSGATVTVTPTVSTSNPGTPLVNTYVVTGTNTNGCFSTSTVSVTANPLPVVTLTANPNITSLYPGLHTTLTANVTPTSSNTTYQWYLNGDPIAGATNQSINVDIDGLGVYSASASIGGNCTSMSANKITIDDSLNTDLFIYPNPNNGIFQVRYNDKLNGEGYPLSIVIYDSKGARVYRKSYAVAPTFGRMDVDLRHCASGVYFVDLLDAAGERLQTGRVVIKP
jgi:hypothetical protein